MKSYRKMLNLIPHLRLAPNHRSKTDNGLLEEAASEFRSIAAAADIGLVGQGLCRDGQTELPIVI